MIVLAHTEVSSGIRVDGSVISPILEGYCGADILVSPIDIPVLNDNLIQKHIDAGAILIQRKSGADLLNSFGDRMNESIMRMHRVHANQSQCVLLFIGEIEPHGDGILLDGNYYNNSYTSVLIGISKWCDRGGVYINLKSQAFLQSFLRSREESLKGYVKEPVKWFTQPLQFIEEVDDWRKTLATFPSVGIKRANAIRGYMLANNLGDDLLTALKVLTDQKKASGLSGIGKVIHASSRSWLGLIDGYDLDISPSIPDTEE